MTAPGRKVHGTAFKTAATKTTKQDDRFQDWSCATLGVADEPTYFRLPGTRIENKMAERSKYQQKIIRNYYENRETIALQRAQEIVTELYLSEGKKRQRHWKSLEGHLLKLEVKQPVIDKLIAEDDPQAAARLVAKLDKAAG